MGEGRDNVLDHLSPAQKYALIALYAEQCDDYLFTASELGLNGATCKSLYRKGLLECQTNIRSLSYRIADWGVSVANLHLEREGLI